MSQAVFMLNLNFKLDMPTSGGTFFTFAQKKYPKKRDLCLRVLFPQASPERGACSAGGVPLQGENQAAKRL